MPTNGAAEEELPHVSISSSHREAMIWHPRGLNLPHMTGTGFDVLLGNEARLPIATVIIGVSQLGFAFRLASHGWIRR